MHDFRPFPGRIIGAVASGSEIRRLVGYQAAVGLQQQQPPVKCPRCDSTNTKFCYYNNYNLSQPRHFCKSCRRYWTKGGVLRNVPVGGGCRKSKRTSSSSSSRPPAKSSDKDPQRRHDAPSSVSGCSSDGLTAAVVASPSTWIPDSILANSQIPVCNPNPPMEPSVPSDSPLCPARDIYQDPTPTIGFSFSDSPLPQVKTVETMRAGFVDQTVPVGTRAGEGSSSVLAAMDWFGSVDPHLFDATDVVDSTGYWNQSHWADADANLYLP